MKKTTWPLRRLKYLATCNDEVLPESTDEDYELEYLDIGNVTSSGTITGTKQLKFKAAPSRARRRVRHGDIIVSTVRTYLRAIARIDNPKPNLIVSTGFAVVRPSHKANADFLGYSLQSHTCIDEVVARSTGVSYPAITASELMKIPVPLAPPSEQRRIADFLDRETEKIDRLIDEKEKLIDLLKEKRKAVISHAVTQGLNPSAKMRDSRVPWLGWIPEHWQTLQLRRLSPYITSGSRGWAKYYADQGNIFVRIGNLSRHSIRVKLEDIQYVDPPSGSEGERTRIQGGDVLVSITAYLGSIGLSDQSVAGGYINQHIALVRLPINTQTMAHYLAYSLLGAPGQAQLGGAGYGGTKVQLGLEDVKALWFALPPKKEQAIIVSWINTRTQKIENTLLALKEAVSLLRERRAALISAAVTGRLGVREAEA